MSAPDSGTELPPSNLTSEASVGHAEATGTLSTSPDTINDAEYDSEPSLDDDPDSYAGFDLSDTEDTVTTSEEKGKAKVLASPVLTTLLDPVQTRPAAVFFGVDTQCGDPIRQNIIGFFLQGMHLTEAGFSGLFDTAPDEFNSIKLIIPDFRQDYGEYPTHGSIGGSFLELKAKTLKERMELSKVLEFEHEHDVVSKLATKFFLGIDNLGNVKDYGPLSHPLTQPIKLRLEKRVSFELRPFNMLDMPNITANAISNSTAKRRFDGTPKSPLSSKPVLHQQDQGFSAGPSTLPSGYPSRDSPTDRGKRVKREESPGPDIEPPAIKARDTYPVTHESQKSTT